METDNIENLTLFSRSSSVTNFQSVVNDQSSLYSLPTLIPSATVSSNLLPSFQASSEKISVNRIPEASPGIHGTHFKYSSPDQSPMEYSRSRSSGMVESLFRLIRWPSLSSFSSRSRYSQMRLPRLRLKTCLCSGLCVLLLSVAFLTMNSSYQIRSDEDLRSVRHIIRRPNISRLLGHIGHAQESSRDRRLEVYPTVNMEVHPAVNNDLYDPADGPHYPSLSSKDAEDYVFHDEERKFSNRSFGSRRSGGPRILCWLMTDPKLLDDTAAARDTWMSRCDLMLFMSSVRDDKFPTIGLTDIKEGRSNIASKSKASWKYIYKHHINDADFFLKGDPDSYIMIDNLRQYLSHCNSSEPNIYGHALWYPVAGRWQTCYVAGQAVVLTRESLRRLVEEAFVKHPLCFVESGEAEDLKTSLCLGLVGARVMDTRDNFGRETFLPPLCPAYNMKSSSMKDASLDWYKKYRPFGYCLEGAECYSERPVAFHCVRPDAMHLMNFLEMLLNNAEHTVPVSTSGGFLDKIPSPSAEKNKTITNSFLSFRDTVLCEKGVPVVYAEKWKTLRKALPKSAGK